MEDQGKSEILPIYLSIRDEVEQVSRQTMSHDRYFELFTTACFVKSYEFNVFVNEVQENCKPFFHTSTLRGLCEDLIVNSFLAKTVTPEDRLELARILLAMNLSEGLASQDAFFKKYRPSQPVLQAPKDDEWRTKHLALAEPIKKKYNWKGNGVLPSVRFMAIACDMGDLYEYLYAATSKWVHFSPGLLLRMGWGENDNLGSVTKFSTDHFSRYYTEFNRVYGSLLFVEFYGSLHSLVGLPEGIGEAVANIRQKLDGELRWPEVITFEEMNVKDPGTMTRILLRTVHEMKQRGELPNLPS